MAENKSVNVFPLNDMASRYCNRDLSAVPDNLSFGLIEKYVQQKTSSSGKEYISKELKYYREKYIHAINGKNSVISSLNFTK